MLSEESRIIVGTGVSRKISHTDMIVLDMHPGSRILTDVVGPFVEESTPTTRIWGYKPLSGRVHSLRYCFGRCVMIGDET